MLYSIYLPASKNFKIFVDRDPDFREKNIYRFNENRIVPVYFYFPHYKEAHIIKTAPGNCTLPHVDNAVQSLLFVRSSKVSGLLKFTNLLRKYRIVLDDMPSRFFVDLSLALTGRGFNMDKGLRIYRKY